VKYLNFNDRFRRNTERAGVDAQARDLRRTVMLRVAEAGATTPQIASVSGYSIEATQRILETHLPGIATLPRSRSRVSPSANRDQKSNVSLTFAP
jgi:hypothetical protein